MSSNAPAAWQPDPTKRHEYRYWDGNAWTDQVADAGVQSTDPLDAANPSTTASEATAKRSKIPMFGARKEAGRLQEENQRLQQLIDDNGLRELANLQAAVDAANAQLQTANNEVNDANQALASARAQRTEAEQDVVSMRAIAGLQEFGLYDYEHPAEDSVKLGGDLESVRAQIKQAVRDGKATSATNNFTFNNSAKQGQKFVNDMSKLMLRSYNAEAENCVKSVKAGNLDAARKRLTKSMEQVEKLGKMINLQITNQYHRLRLTELELAARHMMALQAEKEAERARREELREQKQAEKELAAERSRLEKERDHYANALAKLEASGDEDGAARMREKIADAEKAIEDVDYRAANARAGYVYVISNVGSFGPEVVKIGMTRRLEPMDRVNELGDASVPFRFDVHALFFADDAVALESMLHNHFESRRVNRVNLRREYFRATPAEVLDALKSHEVEVLEYQLEPGAEEFRASVA